jgi:uncharacterized membrane protein
VIPLAISSGLAFVAVVVIAAVLLLWWLLRGETREEAVRVEHEAAQQAEQEAARTADDRLNAP